MNTRKKLAIGLAILCFVLTLSFYHKVYGISIPCSACVTLACDNTMNPCLGLWDDYECNICTDYTSKTYCARALPGFSCPQSGSVSCGFKDDGTCLHGRCIWSGSTSEQCNKGGCS